MRPSVILRGFRDCTLPDEAFGHREHVQVAWHHLLDAPVLDAVERFTAGLRRFAAAHGQADLYHETITWAYLFLIRERMEAGPQGEGWEAFARRNPDLLGDAGDPLGRYYRAETLTSSLARRIFVLPDGGLEPGDPGRRE